MSSYWDSKFLQHIDIKNIKTIFEVGLTNLNIIFNWKMVVFHIMNYQKR